MSQNQSEIVVEERYRTKRHYFELVMLAAYCVPVGAVTVLAIVYGLDQIAWQMYLFFVPIFSIGLICFCQLLYLAIAIVHNSRGVLLVDDQQVWLNTAFFNKKISLSEIIAVQAEYKHFGKLKQIGLSIRIKYKGYSFFPHGLSSTEVSELIYNLDKRIAVARRDL